MKKFVTPAILILISIAAIFFYLKPTDFDKDPVIVHEPTDLGRIVNVSMETSMGTVMLELYPDKAPETVKNFLEYVIAGTYNGTIFHRIIKGFMNQGGGFTTDYVKKDTQPPIPNEAFNGLKNLRGTIAMARTSAPHSATNQFFINTVDNSMLDYTGKNARGWGYAVFGKVSSGMDVIDNMANVETGAGGPFGQDVPKEQIIILKMSEIKEAAETNEVTTSVRE